MYTIISLCWVSLTIILLITNPYYNSSFINAGNPSHTYGALHVTAAFTIGCYFVFDIYHKTTGGLTHADLKNINDKLAFRKYLNELDLETIQMLE